MNSNEFFIVVGCCSVAVLVVVMAAIVYSRRLERLAVARKERQAQEESDAAMAAAAIQYAGTLSYDLSSEEGRSTLEGLLKPSSRLCLTNDMLALLKKMREASDSSEQEQKKSQGREMNARHLDTDSTSGDKTRTSSAPSKQRRPNTTVTERPSLGFFDSASSTDALLPLNSYDSKDLDSSSAHQQRNATSISSTSSESNSEHLPPPSSMLVNNMAMSTTAHLSALASSLTTTATTPWKRSSHDGFSEAAESLNLDSHDNDEIFVSFTVNKDSTTIDDPASHCDSVFVQQQQHLLPWNQMFFHETAMLNYDLATNRTSLNSGDGLIRSEPDIPPPLPPPRISHVDTGKNEITADSLVYAQLALPPTESITDSAEDGHGNEEKVVGERSQVIYSSIDNARTYALEQASQSPRPSLSRRTRHDAQDLVASSIHPAIPGNPRSSPSRKIGKSSSTPSISNPGLSTSVSSPVAHKRVPLPTSSLSALSVLSFLSHQSSSANRSIESNCEIESGDPNPSCKEPSITPPPVPSRSSKMKNSKYAPIMASSVIESSELTSVSTALDGNDTAVPPPPPRSYKPSSTPKSPQGPGIATRARAQSWFHGPISRFRAEELLMVMGMTLPFEERVGLFLVREHFDASTPGERVLCILDGWNVSHHRVS